VWQGRRRSRCLLLHACTAACVCTRCQPSAAQAPTDAPWLHDAHARAHLAGALRRAGAASLHGGEVLRLLSGGAVRLTPLTSVRGSTTPQAYLRWADIGACCAVRGAAVARRRGGGHPTNAWLTGCGCGWVTCCQGWHSLPPSCEGDQAALRKVSGGLRSHSLSHLSRAPQVREAACWPPEHSHRHQRVGRQLIRPP
jgi:hypothetical protein